MEGLSGSAFGDVLRGDDADAVAIIAIAGAQGSVLTNIALIDGLQDFLGAGVTSFGAATSSSAAMAATSSRAAAATTSSTATAG